MSTKIRYSKPICLTHMSGTEFIVDVIQIENHGGGRGVLTFVDGSTEEVSDLDRFMAEGFVDYR